MIGRILSTIAKRSASIELAARYLVDVWPYAARQPQTFWSYFQLLNETEYATAGELQELQCAMFVQTVRHAYTESGFYRRLYDEHGVDVSRIASVEDATKLPVVEKAMLRDASDVTVQIRGMRVGMTSGTSGSPFAFPVDPAADAMERAAIFHQWRKAGFAPGTERVEMRGFQIEPIVHFPDLRIARFSVVNMAGAMRKYVDFLNRRHVAFIHGYPSAIAKFALLLREMELHLDYQVTGILLASEPVYDWQTEVIESVITPRFMVAHYGTAERTVLGAWCEGTRAYHMLPLYGYFETGPNGEIIGTGFVNNATPFIRYRSSDIAIDVSRTPCLQCGRALTPVVGRIGGRMEDYLVDEKDELIPPAVVTFPFKDLAAICSVQVVQDERKGILLRCVTRPCSAELLERDQTRLTVGMQKMLGRTIPICFELVKDIPATQGGKFKWIISRASKASLMRDAH